MLGGVDGHFSEAGQLVSETKPSAKELRVRATAAEQAKDMAAAVEAAVC